MRAAKQSSQDEYAEKDGRGFGYLLGAERETVLGKQVFERADVARTWDEESSG